MKKKTKKRIIAFISSLLLIAVSVFGNPNVIYADETIEESTEGESSSQSVSVEYTKTITNEYSVVIPTVINLNESEKTKISLAENSVIDDDFSVHVDLDGSSFNKGDKDILLYSEKSQDYYVDIRPTRFESDNSFVYLTSSGDKSVAVFYNDSTKNSGGTLGFFRADSLSNYSKTTAKYVGSILFNIYLQYKN